MKYLTTLFVILFSSISLWSQNYRFFGQVLDQTNQTPIEYATITIHQASDSSLLEGVVSDQEGRFSIKAKSAEPVFLQIQFLGYQSFRSELYTDDGNVPIGIIGLSINSATLGEVEVSGKAVTSIQQLDKQIYDASQFQNAQGGTAADVLMNVPSVSVDGFGEISVRGTTGFLVMLNGKPVQSEPMVLLRQLAANAIDDIEIITAPSAKYDPDGKAGIINIKTRQSISEGLFVVANTLIGLPSIERYGNAHNTPRYGADVNLNYRLKKWDLSAGLDYRRYDISGRREGYVNTYLDGILTEFPSDGERSFDEENYAARISATYTPNKNHALAVGLYAGKRTKERTADILYTNQQRSRIPADEFLGTEAYFDLYESSGDVFPIPKRDVLVAAWR